MVTTLVAVANSVWTEPSEVPGAAVTVHWAVMVGRLNWAPPGMAVATFSEVWM